MLRDMGLTDEELEEARRQALEGMMGETPPPAPVPGGSGNRSVEVVPVPTLGAEPGTTKQQAAFDSELEAARGQDRGALFGQNLAQGLHDFNAKYLSGGQPMKAFGAGASAEGQLMADRATKAAKAKAEEARMQAAALAEFKRRGLALTEQQAKGAEADRTADNARADRQLSEMERHNRALEGRKPTPKAKPDTSLRDSSDLRKEFSGLPEVKSFKEVSTAYDKVQRSAQQPSGAGDLSLIFGFMKMLDPGSTVREGEFKNAATAGGLDDRLEAAFAKVKKGERLSEDQRADFVNRARELYGAQRAQFDSQRQRYQGLATKYGLDPGDVADDIAEPGASPNRPQSAPNGVVRVQRIEDGLTKEMTKEAAARLDPKKYKVLE